MAQDGTTAGGASYTLDNVTFPVGRTKLQSILTAIRSTNIGNDAPDLVAGQFWIDNNTPSTTVWTMYFYDGTDSIQFATIDTINNTVNFIDSTFDLINDTTPQLGGTLDANGNNIDMGTNLITDTKVGQWDTAYSWGDHSTQGYLTSETDSQTLSFSNPNLSISNGNSVDLSALDTGILNVVEDVTPQLGGDLDLNSNDITGTGDINTTGTITSTGNITTSGTIESIAPERHSIRPSLNLDFANSKVLDPRITFTRASSGVYYDGYSSVKAEENLYSYSQEFDNSDWTKGNVTLTANDTTAPDGTTTAYSVLQASGITSSGNIKQDISVIAEDYVFSVHAKPNGKNFIVLRETLLDGTFNSTWFNLSTGAVGTSDAGHTSTITASTNSYYRCSIKLNVNASRSGRADILVADTDNSFTVTDSGGIFLWGAQVEQRDSLTAYTATTDSPITKYQPQLQTAQSNVARFDHNPTTGESLGLLIEESRTNLNTYSEDTSGYQKGRSNTTDNIIIAPDGTLTGNKIVGTAVSGSHYVTTTYSASGSLPTGSAYVKAGEKDYMGITIVNDNGTATGSGINLFNLSTGTSVSGDDNPTITDVGNGWYRISVTADTTATTNYGVRIFVYDGTNQSWTGDEYSGAYVWGVQLEAGSFPTSYIKTTGSQVTRSDDSAVMENIDTSDWFKNKEGSIFTETLFYANDDYGTVLSIYDTHNSNDNYFRIMSWNNGSLRIPVQEYQGTTEASITSAYNANEFYKLAFNFERNNVSGYSNGSQEGTDTSCNIPNIKEMRIGGSMTSNSFPLNGTIKKISYYPKVLTSNELIDLTEA